MPSVTENAPAAEATGTATDTGTGTTTGAAQGTGAAPSNPASSRAGTALRWARAQVWMVLPPLVWLYFAWRRRWITDDGLIAARTVREILAGHGPVFNAGERVEANTSALWTWLLAAGSWVTRADVYQVMIGAGLVLAPLGLLFALLGARRLHAPAGRPVIPLGALVVLALPPFWDFATSGLEESLVFFWLGLCWWLMAGLSRQAQSSRRAYALAFTAGLGWLVRPDMALGTVCFLAALWFALRPGLRRSAKLLAAAGALPIAYEVFRMGYYGMLVPNTAVAKEASDVDFTLGMRYLGNFLSPYHLWVPGLVLAATVPAVAGWRRMDAARRTAVAAALASALLMTFYVVAIGGDFMHARMLLPAAFTLLLPVMAVPVPAVDDPRRLVAVALGTALLAGWAGACAAWWRLPQSPGIIPHTGITDERAFWAARVGTGNPTSAAPYVDAMIGTSADPASLAGIFARDEKSGTPLLVFVPPGSTALAAIPLDRPGRPIASPGDILGTLGAALPLNALVIDTHGLSYMLGSHFEPGLHGRVGHDKYAGAVWIVADYSNAVSVPGIDPVQLAEARSALGCGEIAQLRTATEAPLTWGRFWGNVGGSLALTEMRVPNDPAAAVSEYCH
jgi:arabinofuranosyltransferase